MIVNQMIKVVTQLHFRADDPFGGKKDKKTLQVQVIKKIKKVERGKQGSWDNGDKNNR